MKQIKIIIKVERIPLANLTGITRLSKKEVRLPQNITWQPLAVKPHAQLSITDKQEDKNTIWTAKLTFKTCEEFDDRERYAYRCKLTNGKYRLIGTDERPYPVTSVNESIPENVKDNQLNEVTVDWQSALFIPYIRE